VQITINGSNDAPVISVVDVAGSITEGTTLTDSGSITFNDLDLTDLPTATEATASVSTALTLTPTQQAAIENAFTISAAGGNTNNGTINWDYTIAEADLDFLAAGETVTVVFTITVIDGNGGTDTQDVTITITGSDDAAVISGDTSFNGDAMEPVFGTLFATDAEGLTDGTYFTVSSQTANGTAAIDPASGAWTFTPTDPNWFGLDSFTVTVTDDAGGTTTQVVSIESDTIATQAIDDNYSVGEDATSRSWSSLTAASSTTAKLMIPAPTCDSTTRTAPCSPTKSKSGTNPACPTSGYVYRRSTPVRIPTRSSCTTATPGS
jgi:VCBS repeat-containing protein